MVEKLILIGRVAGAFGVKGEVRIAAYGDDPMALLAYRDLKRKDGSTAFTLRSGRAAKGELIATTKDVLVKEAIDTLRGLELYVDRDRLPPPDEDEFYLTDLIGLRAQTPDGKTLGMVKAVQNFGAGDLLEIEAEGAPAFYLPFTREAVPDVRIAEGLVIAVPPTDDGAESGDPGA
jgi:16S rRNA processing protein RimM